MRDVTLAWVAAGALVLTFGAASWNDAQAPTMPPEPTDTQVVEYRQLEELDCFEDEVVVRIVATWTGESHGYDPNRTGTLACVPYDDLVLVIAP